MRKKTAPEVVRKRTLTYLPQQDAFKIGVMKIRKDDIVLALATEYNCHPDDLLEFLRAAKKKGK